VRASGPMQTLAMQAFAESAHQKVGLCHDSAERWSTIRRHRSTSGGKATGVRVGRWVPQAGLTLLELLVALSLLGMLFVVLQQGLTLGQRVWERATTRQAVRLDAVETAQTLLRERLTRANPVFLRTGDGEVTLVGDARAVTFDAPPPGVFGSGTYLRYTLSVTADNVLELAWKPDTDRSPAAPLIRNAVLGGVDRLEIAYFGVGRADRQPRWWSYWRGQPAMPLLVRLRVVFPPGDLRIWPDLLVAPRATVDAQCAWEPVTRNCRGRV